jgi:hypothetical protein
MKHLIEAVIADNPLEVQRLLDSGLDPNGWEDQAKVRPLHFAAHYNARASGQGFNQCRCNGERRNI